MRALIASTLLFACIPLTLQAAAPVSEIGSEPTYNPSPIPVPVPVTPTPQPVAPAAVGDPHYQLQMLQDEVRTLRGMVEELSNDIKQLKARQLDDYMDLDRRLSGMSAGATETQTTPTAHSASTTTTSAATSPAVKPIPASGNEAADYTAAYNALKAGKTAEATALFKQHVEKYPSGTYTANAHYWLGEIYLLQNNLEQARQSFNTVTSSYPAHRKASDATFKLGLVYHLMGDNTQARSLLEKAAAGTDNAAKLAQSYLRENF